MKPTLTILIILCLILSLSSCTTQKYLSVIDGSKASGTLTFAYEYGIFEKPVVHFLEAKQTAVQKCQGWGFKGAEFFDSGLRECIYRDANGNCTRFRVVYKCQCTDQ